MAFFYKIIYNCEIFYGGIIMKAIVNTKLILEDGIIFDGVILFDNGIIKALGKTSDVEIPDGCEIIDAKGKYTCPGFIDIHCHGAGENHFYDNTEECCQHFIEHGETTVLPTLYMDLSIDDIIEKSQIIKSRSDKGVCRIMDGLYMETPYMNFSGSFKSKNKVPENIVPEDYERMLAAVGNHVRVWAIDPAREGIDDFMAYAQKNYPKSIFALGHSSASSDDCKRVSKYGVKVQTHHNDSGKAKGRCQGSIGAGCDEYTLYNPDMYAELIVDETGIHVVPDRIKMVVRTKGVEKIILISDSTTTVSNFKNNEAEGIWYSPDLNYDDRGMLAGSRLTVDNACRNMMVHTGYGLCHAIRMATANPAKMLGIYDTVGTLDVGKRANLLIINDEVRVEKVFLDGELMVDKA